MGLGSFDQLPHEREPLPVGELMPGSLQAIPPLPQLPARDDFN